MVNVFLLLGSNLGDRNSFLSKARSLISTRIAPINQASSVYETQAWGAANSPNYLNQVVLVQTDYPAEVVLNKLLDIEQELGRVRKEKWGDRVIDIDILLYGSAIINLPNLKVPHPRLTERRFALEPLSEIASSLVHPVCNKTISELKKDLSDTLVVKKN